MQRNIRDGYVQSLKRLGANQGMLEWARQSPLQNVHVYHTNMRKGMQGTPGYLQDTCAFLRHRADTYKKHQGTIPDYIQKNIQRKCYI